jgi:hypothetical protein
MTLNNAGHLLDVDVLVAFTDEDHEHHKIVRNWFIRESQNAWGLCAFTEAGFLRVTTRPKTGGRTFEQASAMLAQLVIRPGYRYWPITSEWSVLAAPFRNRLFGHQQITDAYLLGLAVKENGVVVTLDRAMSHLAGAQYSRNLVILE